MRAVAMISALWLLALILFVMAVPAFAHDALSGWSYPLSCCSNYDCREESDAAVKETGEGYFIVSTKELIPYNDSRVRPSPDGLFHACWVGADFDDSRVLCLFAPPRAY